MIVPFQYVFFQPNDRMPGSRASIWLTIVGRTEKINKKTISPLEPSLSGNLAWAMIAGIPRWPARKEPQPLSEHCLWPLRGVPEPGEAPKSFMRGAINLMWYVYIIRSIEHPYRRHIGFTDDVDRRLADHNSGHSPHTSKFRPWKLDVIIGFSDKQKAIAFERYMKSGSGFAFSQKHF